MRNLLISSFIVILVGASYFSYTLYLKPESAIVEGPEVGNTFIDLEVELITNEVIKISELKGDLIILDFMAPWCPSCKEQIKVFKQLSQDGVSIVSINIDPYYNMNSLRDIAGEEDVTWFYGNLPEAALEYKVSAIPLIVFIDQNGIIRYRGFFTPLNVLEQLIVQYK